MIGRGRRESSTVKRPLWCCWLLLAAAPVAGQTPTISGTVTAAGAAFSGGTVAAYTLTGAVAASVSTDSQGRYTLQVPPASYRVVAYDPAGIYATTFFGNAPSFDLSQALTLSASDRLTGVDFSLVRGGVVAGRVVASDTGQPLAGMIVAAYNLTGSLRGFQATTATGTYELLLPPGSFKIAAYDANGVYAVKFYPDKTLFDAAGTITVAASARLNGIDFGLAMAATVAGLVSDRTSGVPLPLITVSAYDSLGFIGGSAVTGADGRFSMTLNPGSWKFVAGDPTRRYAASYYGDASSFASSPSIALASGQTFAAAAFHMDVSTSDPSRTTLFVAAAVNGSGAASTYFQTDVWIYNPSATAPLSVTATYLPGGSDNSAATGVTVFVRAGEQVYLPNLVQNTFHTSGAGALKLEASNSFRAMSRTYNVPPNSPVAGTFGLGMPGLPLSSALSRGVINGLANNSSFRSNVAVMNPQVIPITVKLELYGADGTLLGTASVNLAPLDWFQASTIFAFVGFPSPVDNAYAVVSSQDGAFISYGTVVDQKNGDSTYIAAVSP